MGRSIKADLVSLVSRRSGIKLGKSNLYFIRRDKVDRLYGEAVRFFEVGGLEKFDCGGALKELRLSRMKKVLSGHWGIDKIEQTTLRKDVE